MSLSSFIKSIQLNEREFRKVEQIRESRAKDKAAGKDVEIPPQKHTFMTKISVIYDENNTDFKVSNKPKPEGYGQASLEGHYTTQNPKRMTYSERIIKKSGKYYVFTWWGLYKESMSPQQMGDINDDLVYKARTHLRDMRTPEFVKDVTSGKRQNYVGGHTEPSAFVEMLRKLEATGALKGNEIAQLRTAYQTGGYAAVEKVLNQMIGETGSTAKGRMEGGFVDVYSSDFGVNYKQLTDIAEKTGIDMDVNSEIMMAIPADVNSQQEKRYEKWISALLKRKLEMWAEKNLDLEGEGTGSPNIGEMTAEILAAAMMGKKAPKYKSDYKKELSKPKSSIQRANIKKGKKRGGTVSKVALVKAKHQLRANKGAMQNPTALKNLINRKLPEEVQKNMHPPALQNRSGKFAESIRVIQITAARERAKLANISFTYDRDPYGVFEMQDGDPRWATAARDPKMLIDRSIREIAAGILQERFTTQRL